MTDLITQAQLGADALVSKLAHVETEIWDLRKELSNAQSERDAMRDQLSDANQTLFDLRRSLSDAQDGAQEYRNLLKAILDIESEREAIGGGPGWKERREQAFSAAWDRFEP